MLIIYLVQMIGAEVNDEKTTRGMEIIISNVSPKTHFFSKVLAGNFFVFLQGTILFLAGVLGFVVRGITTKTSFLNNDVINLSDILSSLEASGVLGNLWIYIPLTLILLVLSFLAYSLVAGILGFSILVTSATTFAFAGKIIVPSSV